MEDQDLRSTIREMMAQEFKQFLSDIEFRVAQAYDVAQRTATGVITKIYAEDLATGLMLTGYTVSNNTPSAGYIEWASLNIVYNGTTDVITNGSTNDMYVWWDPAVSATTLQMSNTQPTLTSAAALIFVNNSGTATVAVGATMPPAVGQNSVNTAAIVAGAVGNTALASGAVAAGNIQSGAVGSTQLATSAVQSGNIATGAVGSSALASGAVTSGAIASGAVGSAALASGAVTNSALASGAVSASNLNVLTHYIF